MPMKKSHIRAHETFDHERIGRSYYCFCLEQALANIRQARALVAGDVVDRNHELSRIETLISDALDAS